MSTWDEPSKNSEFKDTLINNFGALQTNGWYDRGWDFRGAYVLIAKKDDVNNNGLIYEK